MDIIVLDQYTRNLSEVHTVRSDRIYIIAGHHNIVAGRNHQSTIKVKELILLNGDARVVAGAEPDAIPIPVIY